MPKDLPLRVRCVRAPILGSARKEKALSTPAPVEPAAVTSDESSPSSDGSSSKMSVAESESSPEGAEGPEGAESSEQRYSPDFKDEADKVVDGVESMSVVKKGLTPCTAVASAASAAAAAATTGKGALIDLDVAPSPSEDLTPHFKLDEDENMEDEEEDEETGSEEKETTAFDRRLMAGASTPSGRNLYFGFGGSSGGSVSKESAGGTGGGNVRGVGAGVSTPTRFGGYFGSPATPATLNNGGNAIANLSPVVPAPAPPSRVAAALAQIQSEAAAARRAAAKVAEAEADRPAWNDRACFQRDNSSGALAAAAAAGAGAVGVSGDVFVAAAAAAAKKQHAPAAAAEVAEGGAGAVVGQAAALPLPLPVPVPPTTPHTALFTAMERLREKEERLMAALAPPPPPLTRDIPAQAPAAAAEEEEEEEETPTTASEETPKTALEEIPTTAWNDRACFQKDNSPGALAAAAKTKVTLAAPVAPEALAPPSSDTPPLGLTVLRLALWAALTISLVLTSLVLQGVLYAQVSPDDWLALASEALQAPPGGGNGAAGAALVLATEGVLAALRESPLSWWGCVQVESSFTHSLETAWFQPLSL
jgi:hypothetical protein